MKGGGKIEPPKATAALLSRLGWEDREIHAQLRPGEPGAAPLAKDAATAVWVRASLPRSALSNWTAVSFVVAPRDGQL
jgi:hypothetical protein